MSPFPFISVEHLSTVSYSKFLKHISATKKNEPRLPTVQHFLSRVLQSQYLRAFPADRRLDGIVLHHEQQELVLGEGLGKAGTRESSSTARTK